MGLSVETVLDTVRAEIGRMRGFGLLLCWLRFDGDRDEACAALRGSLDQGEPIVPIVLRSRLFSDPNSWAMDVATLIAERREDFEELREQIVGGRPLSILVIAKTDLSTAQSSSPASLPQWFPRYGGQEVTAYVRDIKAIAGTSLKGSEGRLDELSFQLFRIERAACNRFSVLLSNNKHHGQPLWNSLLQVRSGLESRQMYLAAWAKSIEAVSDVHSFRPTLKDKGSLVGALWASFVDSPPSKLGSTGEAVRDFLGFDEKASIGGLDPLLPILFRGVNDANLSPGAKLGRSLIVLVGGSCQLTTASAHADQYGRVHASALSSLSLDMRQCLANFESALQ